MINKKINPYHVGVAAEAFAAGSFALLGYDVTVQYGANQPGYDLVVVKGDKILKVNVKGSQDGGWGVNQSYKKGRTYFEAADVWLKAQGPNIVFCFVQFKGVAPNHMPRMYLATSHDVAKRLKESANGRGETILYERKDWTKRAYGRGTVDKIPSNWNFSESRIADMFR